MSGTFALSGARIFDGENWHEDNPLLVRDGMIQGIVPWGQAAGYRQIRLDGGILAPGFVDLQVNGGGGLLFNDAPTLETIRTICRAHLPFGTTALLPTLITDTREITAAAIKAGKAAASEKLPGFLGLHLEGPHLSTARKGAHDPKLIRPLDDGDMRMLLDAAKNLPALLVTVAPETVSPEQIAALAKGGVTISLGHSDASYETAAAAIEAGARQVTHLFNAMSPLAHRDPGLVGAALESGTVFAGLIADGIHVDPHAIRIALRAKNSPGRIFLVTDAMATIGTDMAEFTLNGRKIKRANGRLTLEDGTLAGADLDMISAMRFMHQKIGLDLGEALRMASLYPAMAIGHSARSGHLKSGAVASFLHLSDQLEIRGLWVEGEKAL